MSSLAILLLITSMQGFLFTIRTRKIVHALQQKYENTLLKYYSTTVTNGKKEAWKGYLCVATERKVKNTTKRKIFFF
jgi:serine/threonine-protein kinase RIO1